MEVVEQKCENTENPMMAEFSIADILDTSHTQSHDVHMMRHYLLRMLKKKNHEQYLSELPAPILKRILALKKLQIDTMELDAVFHRQAFEMEKDFQKKHEKIFQKRLDIIMGAYEPSEDDCQLPPEAAKTSKPLSTLDISEKMSQMKLATTSSSTPSAMEDIKGIPDFWLTVLKYVPKVDVLVKEYDEPLLKHLTDIKVRTQSEPELSFTLEFHFSPNEYFSNARVDKEYFMKCRPDPTDPFSFDGPEIYKTTATKIEWMEGKNVTMEKTADGDDVGRASFFNFFLPPELPQDPNHAMFMTINAILESDFEVGHYLKDRVIPRAVLYFTGEAKDDPDYESSVGDSNLEMVFENPDDDKDSKSVADESGDAADDDVTNVN